MARELLDLLDEYRRQPLVRANPSAVGDIVSELALGRFHEWLLAAGIDPVDYSEGEWLELLEACGITDGEAQAQILEGVANYMA